MDELAFIPHRGVDEIDSTLTTQARLRLGAAIAGSDEIRSIFDGWFGKTLGDSSIDKETCFAMYTGKVTISKYVDSLSEDQQLEFIAALETLEEAKS